MPSEVEDEYSERLQRTAPHAPPLSRAPEAFIVLTLPQLCQNYLPPYV